jgi:hypothetical protein
MRFFCDDCHYTLSLKWMVLVTNERIHLLYLSIDNGSKLYHEICPSIDLGSIAAFTLDCEYRIKS